jgi:hypothetical protein
MGMRNTTFRGIAVFIVCAAWAGGLVEPVNKDKTGLALKGYDPVGYFEQAQPVKGSPDFTYLWMGASWRFASAAHRDRFAADPQKYAPQFGGYCSWAVSEGHTAEIDPAAWKIIDGHLYLNYNKDIQKKWEQDVEQRIEAARKNWPTLHK